MTNYLSFSPSALIKTDFTDHLKIKLIHIFCIRLRHLNMEKNQITQVPHLKCVEGRIFIYNVSEPNTKGQHSGSHKSLRSVISQNAGPERVNDLSQRSPSIHEEVSLVETIMDTTEGHLSSKKAILGTQRQGECADAGAGADADADADAGADADADADADAYADADADADAQKSNEEQSYHGNVVD